MPLSHELADARMRNVVHTIRIWKSFFTTAIYVPDLQWTVRREVSVQYVKTAFKHKKYLVNVPHARLTVLIIHQFSMHTTTGDAASRSEIDIIKDLRELVSYNTAIWITPEEVQKALYLNIIHSCIVLVLSVNDSVWKIYFKWPMKKNNKNVRNFCKIMWSFFLILDNLEDGRLWLKLVQVHNY